MSRAIRRHQFSRIKAKYLAVLKLWRRPGTRRSDTITPQELGRIATQHATHICGMCHHDKLAGIPKIKASESSRTYDLSD